MEAKAELQKYLSSVFGSNEFASEINWPLIGRWNLSLVQLYHVFKKYILNFYGFCLVHVFNKLICRQYYTQQVLVFEWNSQFEITVILCRPKNRVELRRVFLNCMMDMTAISVKPGVKVVTFFDPATSHVKNWRFEEE